MTERWRVLLLLHVAVLVATALSSSLISDSSTLLSALQPNGEAEIRVVSPSSHSWWTVDEATGKLRMLVVRLALRGFSIPDDGYLRIGGEKVDGPESSVNTFIVRDSLSAFTMYDVEPGTYFFSLELIKTAFGDVEHIVAETALHIEVVAPRSSSPMITHEAKETYMPPRIHNLKLEEVISTMQSPVPICYITSVGGSFDGQKKMWLQIIEALASPRNKSVGQVDTSKNTPGKTPFTTNFRFEAVTFGRIADDSPMRRALAQLGIRVRGGSPEVRSYSAVME